MAMIGRAPLCWQACACRCFDRLLQASLVPVAWVAGHLTTHACRGAHHACSTSSGSGSRVLVCARGGLSDTVLPTKELFC